MAMGMNVFFISVSLLLSGTLHIDAFAVTLFFKKTERKTGKSRTHSDAFLSDTRDRFHMTFTRSKEKKWKKFFF